jgi:hypothetical protein
VVIALLIGILIGGWYIHQHGTWVAVRMVESKLFPKTETTPVTTPEPTAVTTAVPTTVPTKTVSVSKPKSVPQAVIAQQALLAKPWVPDEETQTNLESEFAALPKFSLVESLSFQPNTGIEGAMAARRLQDLTDPDKYTFFIGHDAQKVTNVYADTTSLNITYQNGLIGLVTGGTSKMDFYWEDVRAVHCCEIQSPNGPKGKKLFQCSLVLADAKQPFVAQCSSATNFGRLVSALEFWIQASGNKAIVVTGLPYMNHGFLMNNDRVVTQVWAKSPADVASLKPGDHLWSTGTNTRDQQNTKLLLSALQSEGPLTLFTVIPAEWEKAKAAMMQKNGNDMNPKRQKIVIGS